MKKLLIGLLALAAAGLHSFTAEKREKVKAPIEIQLIVDNQTNKNIRFEGSRRVGGGGPTDMNINTTFEAGKKRSISIPLDMNKKYFSGFLMENGKWLAGFNSGFDDTKNQIFATLNETIPLGDGVWQEKNISREAFSSEEELINVQILLTLKGDDLTDSSLKITESILLEPSKEY